MRKAVFGATLLLLCVGMAPLSVAQAQSRPSAAGHTPHPSAMGTGIYRGNPVTYEIIDGKPIFEGDIVLDHVTDLAPGQPPAKGATPQAPGIAYPQYFWPKNGSGVAEIPYIVTSGATNLAAALSQFNTTFAGIIQFVARTSQADYVNFNFNPNDDSGTGFSSVGRAGGMQVTGGAFNCSLGTLLHEMGHDAGLFHEQSRPDRDSFVTVSFANMIKGSKPNFDQLIDNYQNLGLYDYGSVMHYIAFAFSRNGGPVIESIPAGIPLSNLVGYTAADIDGIKRLYGAAPTSVTVTTNPPGLTVTVNGTNFTTPQTFSWPLNSTQTLAVPDGAQTLAGATYVYGRWNDSTAASHTIIVTPGNKTLASPATSPAVTVYTANFIELAIYTAAVVPEDAGTVSASPPAQAYPGASGVFYVARQQVTLSAAANDGYSFLQWDYGIRAPWSANPKADYVPENSGAYNVTGNFSTLPVTTITTDPPGLGLFVDGGFWYGPQNFAADYFPSWTPGSTHTVSSFTPQRPRSINSRYAFASWSDGGTLEHTIVAPGTDMTFTASFTPQFVPIAYATPSCAASVALAPGSPDGFYSKGTVVTVTANTALGWVLTGWQGDLAGTANPQNLTVDDEELAVANYDTTAAELAITSLAPARLTAGSAGQTLSITGTGFTPPPPSSIVFINNVYRTSQFVSATQINVNLTSADVARPGAFPVGVSNFPSGAPCSAYMARTFFVTAP